jgi:hypothetical protein
MGEGLARLTFWLATFLVNCLVLPVVCYICGGPLRRIRQERAVMQEYENRLHHAIQQHNMGSESIDQVKPKESLVGPTRTERLESMAFFVVWFCFLVLVVWILVLFWPVRDMFVLATRLETGKVPKDWGGNNLSEYFVTMDINNDSHISISELALGEYLFDFKYYVQNFGENGEEPILARVDGGREYVMFETKLFLLADRVTEGSDELDDGISVRLFVSVESFL